MSTAGLSPIIQSVKYKANETTITYDRELQPGFVAITADRECIFLRFDELSEFGFTCLRLLPHETRMLKLPVPFDHPINFRVYSASEKMPGGHGDPPPINP